MWPQICVRWTGFAVAGRAGAGRDDAAGDDPAAQDHARAEAGVGVRVVAEDVDRAARDDLAVRVGRDVVADPQEHEAGDRRDPAVRDRPCRVLDEQHGARCEQAQVLVGVRSALAHGDADVAAERFGEHEPEPVRRAVGLGDEDAAVGLHAHVADTAGRRRGAGGVDVEVVGAGVVADVRAAAVRVEIDRAADHVGVVVVVRVDDRTGAGPRHERDVARRPDASDPEIALRLEQEDALRERRGGVGHRDHACRGPGDVAVDLEEVGRDADAADAALPSRRSS